MGYKTNQRGGRNRVRNVDSGYKDSLGRTIWLSGFKKENLRASYPNGKDKAAIYTPVNDFNQATVPELQKSLPDASAAFLGALASGTNRKSINSIETDDYGVVTVKWKGKDEMILQLSQNENGDGYRYDLYRKGEHSDDDIDIPEKDLAKLISEVSDDKEDHPAAEQLVAGAAQYAYLRSISASRNVGKDGGPFLNRMFQFVGWIVPDWFRR